MLNYATIGSSWITKQMIQAAKLTQRYHLKAVYSRHVDTAKHFAKEHQADYYTNELNNILFDPEIHVIYIASPNSLHAQQALQAVQAGKHVIVEKPIFTSSAQWYEVYDAADSHQVYVFEAVKHYHSRNYSRLRPLIKQKLQENTHPFVGANFNIGRYSSRFDTYIEARENQWEPPNVFNSEFHGGSLMDLGIYPLYIAVDLFGMPKSVRYHAIDDENQIDLYGNVVLVYPKGQVSIFVSQAAQSQLPSEIYIGEETFVIQDISRITKAKLINRYDEQVQLVDYQPANPMYDELLTFAEMIENTKNVHREIRYENWRQLSLQVTQILELLRQSAKLY
ncbi:Gfo/Idh/MocA family oxidoreductase [Facklamia sp. DSM 111018]|uniref:Gfo/Idh/MocA family oxidoreductase n=1 Tax=Facklamia lactis TaxID=2749967 RepID=A0ABS0LRL5_9LACT|nr:Gfo/Idh/MocA family oxidoreductase [Facklamia lactis]MBG9980836.1 Gfo/Idh/MocA family oxidoreductase [Facklamia lactis]MBG9986801.1 Gfo/Idh/MocA family oxidoreductase [Facklamia lactis]